MRKLRILFIVFMGYGFTMMAKIITNAIGVNKGESAISNSIIPITYDRNTEKSNSFVSQ